MFRQGALTVFFIGVMNADLTQLNLVEQRGQHLLRGYLVRGKGDGVGIAGNPSVPFLRLLFGLLGAFSAVLHPTALDEASARCSFRTWIAFSV